MNLNSIFTFKAIKATLLVLFAASTITNSSAQTTEQSEVETISISTRLVSVTVRATDSSSRPVSVVPASLRLLADGVAQEIAFADGEGPATVGLLVDTSSSMRGLKAKRTMRAISEFIKAADPRNRYTLFAFSDRVERLGDFDASSGTRSAILKLLEERPRYGSTALYDACIEAGQTIRARADRTKRALVVFTDGTDTVSRANKSSLRESLNHLGGLVYVVVFDSRLSAIDPHHASPVLKNLAGAEAAAQLRSTMDANIYLARTDEDLVKAARDMSVGLARAIQLGFYPSGELARPGSHSLRVEVGTPGIQVQSRSGYEVK